MLRGDFTPEKLEELLHPKIIEDVKGIEVEDSLLLKYGINKDSFHQVFGSLLRNWYFLRTSLPDCEGKRFVNEYLFDDLKNPIKLAIISDDLEVFKKHCSLEEFKNCLIFDLCCVCGSEKIIYHYFFTYQYGESWVRNSEYALAFALSSGKHDFALKLAIKAKNMGRKNPGFLALYSISFKVLKLCYSQKK